MSAVNVSCYALPREKESGGGEMHLPKPPSCEGSASAHVIASEIVTDIVDNAYEVVTAKSLGPPSKVEKITPNVVGDILDNILSTDDETALLDDEIKKIINEMKYPPIVSTKGLGDQLESKSEIGPDAIPSEPVKRNTLERKNRLTNLVRNSKQMLVKLVNNEKENEVRLTKSEEIHEKLLKVIDLQGEEHYVEPGSSSTTGILKMPTEVGLDMVELERALYEGKGEKEEEVCEKGVSKKKLGLKAKIMKYIKRNKEGKK